MYTIKCAAAKIEDFLYNGYTTSRRVAVHPFYHTLGKIEDCEKLIE